MKIDGGCLCGHITYEAEIDPAQVSICHCTDCQTLSGSAFRIGAPTPDSKFKLLSGTLKTFVKTAESGAKRAQAFCPECGTQLYSTSPGEGPKTLRLRVATSRQRYELRPTLQGWTRSAQDWLGEIDSIPKFDGQRPAGR